jgi:hypothetical protein
MGASIIFREATAPAVQGGPRVLVVGVNFVMTWRLVNCLEEAGVHPTVLCQSRMSPAGWGRRETHFFPDRQVLYEDDRLNATALGALARLARNFEVVLPADFDCTVACARLRLPQWLGPSGDAIERIHDKGTFTTELQNAGLPVPASVVVRSARDWASARQLGFPLIAKPLASSDSRGVVRIGDARSFDEHRGLLNAALPLIVQREVNGWDIGVSVLARDGEVYLASMFDRPTNGARDFFWNEELLADTRRVVRHFGYTGVAHFDLMFDRQTRRHLFLECNPRYWGSLLYAKSAGVNFPAAHVDLTLRATGRRPGAAASPAALNATGRLGRVTIPPAERALQMVLPRYEIGVQRTVERAFDRVLPRR